MNNTRADQAAAIESLSEEIGDINERNGFREDWERAELLESLAERLRHTDAGETMMSYGVSDSTTVSDWLVQTAEVLRNNIIGMKLALIHSEVSEALESLRHTGFKDVRRAGNLFEELADAEIRIKDLNQMLGGGLGEEEARKIDKNAKRPYKHGKVI